MIIICAQREFLEAYKAAATEHSNAERLPLPGGRSLESDPWQRLPCESWLQLDGHTLALHFRQVERIVLSAPFETRLQPVVALPHMRLEHTPTHVVSADLRAIAQRSAQVHRLAILVGKLKRHACRQTLHQLSALRIETAEQLLLRFAAHVLLRPLIYVLAHVVTLVLRLAVYGEHAREQTVPLAEEVFRHLVVVEQVAVVARIVSVADVEVQHPPRVGPQLIVARIERVLQHELPACMAVAAHDDALSLHYQSVGREQLHVEQSAHVGGLQVVSSQHVGLIPQCVTDEVARVVSMHIHFLLHLRIVGKRLLQVVEAVG